MVIVSHAKNWSVAIWSVIGCCMCLQVQTLLSRMEQLRSDGSLPTPIHTSVTQLKDVIVKVQMCRRDEIVNAINRHQHRDVSTPMQKEKGHLSHLSIVDRMYRFL